MDLVGSFINFSGKCQALGVQQVVNMVLTDDRRSDANAGTAFKASLLETAFNLLPVQPRSVSDLLLLPLDVLNFFLATRQVVPSSSFLVNAMTAPLPLEQSELVVEFGPGTGVMTRELLRRLPAHANLLTFETNSRLASQMRLAVRDSRLQVIEASAETAGQALRKYGCKRVDGVVSSLGLTVMSDRTKKSVFEALLPYLDERSVLTQFQYLNAVRISSGCIQPYDAGTFLGQFFCCVMRQVVLLNVPPAVVFTCRGPMRT